MYKKTGLAHIDNGKPAAAKLASTLIRSALDATATFRPLFLHCCTSKLNHKITKGGSEEMIMPFVNHHLTYLGNDFKGTRESNSRIWFCILQEIKETFKVRKKMISFTGIVQ